MTYTTLTTYKDGTRDSIRFASAAVAIRIAKEEAKWEDTICSRVTDEAGNEIFFADG